MKENKSLSKLFKSLVPSKFSGKSAMSCFISQIDEQNAAHDKKFKKVEKDIENARKRPARKRLPL
ncbi:MULTISPECIES: hypothetical protein [Wohlfahrtiimonas]|uniref:hypothetical protein n=1 Tax=Wohlfahrtiimonas TaxID=582472 RepID=UPI000B98F6E8|nr:MULTISPECIES: hypothetical protein [Wohlfahrtiimonas]MBS7815892.1 hypothetical protein [Wohlfahrtiimonas chitiniclastica]MBS7822113.1 hypothetical protein [Wohlfahrtiimonas chitiniclastica]MBS7829905.1 hypothetical protein [Wohlfahrtiimonas chitiniclastica]MBS7831872.1 hypothetical protein [Wohlfahrtiimonas chitiniclastica]OYQ69125.1 hypothetical protein B9T13_10020 [Wohlfahrtiimonas chitiniclastica]